MNIKDLAKKYGLKKDDFWSVRDGIWVVKHDAVERIADEENVRFQKPDVYFEMDSVMMLGSAKKGQKEIWSTGEASKTNVKGQGGYYMAMAEKRLKDRLTLKLINAYEYGIYSDSEADDFKKNGQRKKVEKKRVGEVVYVRKSGKKNGRSYEGWVPKDEEEFPNAPKFWTDKNGTCDAKLGRAQMDYEADKAKKEADDGEEEVFKKVKGKK